MDIKDFIITKGCIKSIAKKNKNLEEIFTGHDCYSFWKFPNSIPISNQMTKYCISLYITFSIFVTLHAPLSIFVKTFYRIMI